MGEFAEKIFFLLNANRLLKYFHYYHTVFSYCRLILCKKECQNRNANIDII